MHMMLVYYPGHVFSDAGMIPDSRKVDIVLQWSATTSVIEVSQFLGIASNYRCYNHYFSKIAAPLHNLMQKGASFDWNQKCIDDFITLKQCLIQAPVLAHPV